MARGRMVSTTIATDIEFNSISLESQLLFLRTIPHLDRDGLIFGEPFALWAKVASMTGHELMLKSPELINEWVNAGLVIRYNCKVGAVLFFTGFAANQTGMRYDREAESAFPPPPGWKRIANGIVPIDGDDPSDSGDVPPEENEPDGPTPAELRQNSGERVTEDQVQVKDQVKDQERGGEDQLVLDDPDGFDGPKTTPPKKVYGTVTTGDARKFDADGLMPAGQGKNAVDVYREFYPDHPMAGQRQAIKEKIENLDLWREVVQAWLLAGYNMRNFEGMFDWYDNPQNFRSRKNGKATGRNQRSANGTSDRTDTQRAIDEGTRKLRESGFTLTTA